MKEYIKCPMQRNMKVNAAWCDHAQSRELCKGCTQQVRPNREISNYQQELKNGHKDVSKNMSKSES